jgi:hypothetical protein
MPLPPGARDQFKILLEAATADAAWECERDARNVQRLAVVPQLLGLLQQLRDGTIAVPTFRETFDARTRKDWDVFGLKGMSGAMFLNKLVLHVPDQAALRRELLAAVALPETVQGAQEQMSAFLRFLDGMIDTGDVTKMKLQPGRAPFFLSAWWHLQARESWPTYYESARWALAEIGLFSESGDSLRDYFSFRTCWLDIAQEFQLDTWALEAVLIHAHSSKEQNVPATTAAVPIAASGTPARDDDGEAAPKHSEVQWMLAQIGHKLGLKVWIASNDQGRTWNGRRLGDLSITQLPNLGIGEDSQKIVNLIDVLWLRGNNQLVSAFEIECSTSIYSGVLRMSDLSTTCPNLSFPCYIALPAEREAEVIRQLSRPTFQALELHRRCGYFTVEDIKTEVGHMLKWAKDADCIRQLAKWVGDIR